MEELTLRVLLNENFTNRDKRRFSNEKVKQMAEKRMNFLFGTKSIVEMEIHLRKAK